MYNIAIARLRTAAAFLEARSELITVDRLAFEVGEPSSRVRSYLKGVTGLNDELRVTSRLRWQSSKGQEYCKATAKLAASGIAVTVHRIAVLTQTRVRTVDMWMVRHRKNLSVEILTAAQLRVSHNMTKLQWVRILNPNHRFMMYEIAKLLGYERTYLYRVMHNNPKLGQLIHDLCSRTYKG